MPSPGGPPWLFTIHHYFCPDWEAVVHLCTLRSSCGPGERREEVGFPGGGVSRNCRSLVWFTGEASGVSEDMVPFRVFGHEATAPWVRGASSSRQASPAGPLHPASPFLGFLTAGSVSTCDWLVSFWFLLIQFSCWEGVVFFYSTFLTQRIEGFGQSQAFQMCPLSKPHCAPPCPTARPTPPLPQNGHSDFREFCGNRTTPSPSMPQGTPPIVAAAPGGTALCAGEKAWLFSGS